MSDHSKNIDKSIKELKNLAKILVPYNYPIWTLSLQDDDLLIFKTNVSRRKITS